MKLILASKSPRREKILRRLGLSFEIHESRYEEDFSVKKDPYELVKFLALQKGLQVAKSYDNAIIISADTLILFDGKVIGKPKNIQKAREVLRELSGKTHLVLTGFAVINTKTGLKINDFGAGEVSFGEIEEEELELYLKKAVWNDKAGGYAIQEEGGVFIDGVSGDYYSIVGLPLRKVYQSLKKMGVSLLK